MNAAGSAAIFAEVASKSSTDLIAADCFSFQVGIGVGVAVTVGGAEADGPLGVGVCAGATVEVHPASAASTIAPTSTLGRRSLQNSMRISFRSYPLQADGRGFGGHDFGDALRRFTAEGVQLVPVVLQPQRGPSPSPRREAPRGKNSLPRGRLECFQREPRSPGRQPLAAWGNSPHAGIAHGLPVAQLATEGRLVCLLLVQTAPSATATASETENAMTSSTFRPEYISLQDAAALYAVSVDLLRERIRTGELPAVHAGRRLIRVRLDDLRRVFRPLPAARRYRQTA